MADIDEVVGGKRRRRSSSAAGGFESRPPHSAGKLGIAIHGRLIPLAFTPKLVLNLFLGRKAYLSGLLFERRERNPVLRSWATRCLELRSGLLR
jgi:hypothetical protein